MDSGQVTAAVVLCRTLEKLGIDTIFGLPGTHAIPFFEALRRSRLHTVLSTHELGATFMANGYYRSCGRMAAVTAIPGPGLTYALTGLAEARDDSAALLLITFDNSDAPGSQFRFQVMDTERMFGSVAKAIVRADTAARVPVVAEAAFAQAIEGEPGPVILEIPSGLLTEAVSEDLLYQPIRPLEPPRPSDEEIDQLLGLLADARRPLLMIGQGAAGAAGWVVELAGLLHCPVVSTASGRGVVPDDDPLFVSGNFGIAGASTLNDLIAASDLVLALGCKLSHNGTAGFRLKIPPTRFIHVDASADVLGANYPARLAVRADTQQLLAPLLRRLGREVAVSTDWTDDELASWRAEFRQAQINKLSDLPQLKGLPPTPIEGFLDALRAAMPDDAVVVTDSGYHQILTRSFLPIYAPRGLVHPSDFQAMGFGIPAAIGAALSQPRRPVVAIVGDGGLAMTAMELTTAVRERLPLTVIVFNDQSLSLIKRQQWQFTGADFATTLTNPDYHRLAQSFGVNYVAASLPLEPLLRQVIFSDRVSLVEVKLQNQLAARLKRAGKSALKRTLGR